MKKGSIYIAAFLIFWIILAERTALASTIAGLIIALIIFAYVKESYEGVSISKSLKLIPRWILFLAELIGAIIVANFQVAVIVLSKDMSIDPHVVKYKTALHSEVLKTILANAITLTPGTMSVDIQGQTLMIHCLNREYAEALDGNAFERTLVKIQEAYHDN